MPRQCLYQGQRQRHRSTTKQQQQQCTTTGTATAITSCAVQSVIQNVMECSIANVCANRGIFPKTFFEYRTVHDGTVVPRFDKEYLDRNVDDNVGVAVVESGLGDDVSGDTSESDYSNYGNNHTRKARKHNNHNSKRMKKTNTENNLLKEEARLLLQWIQNGIGQSIQEGIVSRVTLGICLTNTRHAAGLHAYPLDMTPTPSIVETNTMNTSCRYDTLSATTTGMTKTTTQPISAISSTMTTSTSSTSPPQSKSCSATRNQMTSGDQLVESYSFDIIHGKSSSGAITASATAIPSYATKSRFRKRNKASKKRKVKNQKNEQQHQQQHYNEIQQEACALFRNLNGLVSALPPLFMTSSLSSSQSQIKSDCSAHLSTPSQHKYHHSPLSLDQQSTNSKYHDTISALIPPSMRYLTLQIEFRNDNNSKNNNRHNDENNGGTASEPMPSLPQSTTSSFLCYNNIAKLFCGALPSSKEDDNNYSGNYGRQQQQHCEHKGRRHGRAIPNKGDATIGQQQYNTTMGNTTDTNKIKSDDLVQSITLGKIGQSRIHQEQQLPGVVLNAFCRHNNGTHVNNESVIDSLIESKLKTENIANGQSDLNLLVSKKRIGTVSSDSLSVGDDDVIDFNNDEIPHCNRRYRKSPDLLLLSTSSSIASVESTKNKVNQTKKVIGKRKCRDAPLPLNKVTVIDFLAPQTEVFAIPYGLKNTRHPSSNRDFQEVYLPCTVLDYKVESYSNKNMTKDEESDIRRRDGVVSSEHVVKYKLTFPTCKALKRKRMMKQWIPSERILSMEEILNRVEEAAREDHCLCVNDDGAISITKESIEKIARAVKLQQKVVEAALCAMEYQIREGDDTSHNLNTGTYSSQERQFSAEREENDDASVDRNSDRQNGTLRNVAQAFFYSYAVNPILVNF